MKLLNKLRLAIRHGRSNASDFIHPSAKVCRKSTLDFPVRIARDAELKRVRLARYSYIALGTRVTNATIGRYSSIGPECLVGGLGHHPANYFSTSPATYSKSNPISVAMGVSPKNLGWKETAPVTIAEDVWIGARCIILDGIEIGRGAIIGANTLVTKNVPPYSIYFGSPPKIHRSRFSPEIIAALEATEWWTKAPEDFDYNALEKIVGWKSATEPGNQG